MGKITSIYLTDEEAEELKRFCCENNCTQYSVLKTAVKEILARPAIQAEEKVHGMKEALADAEGEPEPDNVQEEGKKKLRTLRLRSILQKLQEL